MVEKAATAERVATAAMAPEAGTAVELMTITVAITTRRETVAMGRTEAMRAVARQAEAAARLAMDQAGGVYSARGMLLLQNTTISGNSAAPGVPGKAGSGGAPGVLGKGGPGGLGLHPGTNGVAGAPGTRGSDGVEGSTAESFGGGVDSVEDAASSIHNCTIAGNKAGTGGGGLAVMPPGQLETLSVISTIIAQNRAAKDSDIRGMIEIGHDLIESVGDAVFIGDKSTLIVADPKLGALADNGGPTRTMLLLAGSPALNAGSNPDALATDQRGAPRLIGVDVDIGAVEVS